MSVSVAASADEQVINAIDSRTIFTPQAYRDGALRISSKAGRQSAVLWHELIPCLSALDLTTP